MQNAHKHIKMER